MMATANGVDTQPVLRGVWLLENIFGDLTPEPPSNVPAIEPDTSGAKTIRELLSRHQADPNCASCHRRIDPPGFALENFDPVGRWREHYPVYRKRAGNGGGLSWWNPTSNRDAGLCKPFSNHQIAYLCAAGDGCHIVISTVRVGDLVLKKPTPREGRLFVFDDTKKEIVREITVEKGVRGPGPIAWAGDNRAIGWTNDPRNGRKSILYGVDVEQGVVAWRKSLPFKLPIVIGSNQKVRWDFRRGPDGHIWTFMGRNANILVGIDPITGAVEGVAQVSRGGRLAFSSSDIYISGSTFLRRIRNVVDF